MIMDFFIILTSFSNFALFLFLHAALLRRYLTQPASAMILLSFIVGFIETLFSYTVFSFVFLFPEGYSLPAVLLGGSVSCFLYTLLVFHYIAWVFGMGEAAIRIRLLFELAKHPVKGLSLEDFYERYNAESILSVRLARLVNAGHISLEGDIYKIKNRILLFQVFLNNLMKSLLGHS